MASLPEDHDSQWEVVYTTDKLYKAELFRGMLEEEGIESIIINKQDSSYISFGEVELYVPREEILNAKQIMERAGTGE